MDAKQRFMAAYYGLVLYFRKIDGPFIPEKMAQTTAREVITETTRCIKAWGTGKPGGILGEAIDAAVSFDKAYQLLLAYAECMEANSETVENRILKKYGERNTTGLRVRALEAAKEVG